MIRHTTALLSLLTATLTLTAPARADEFKHEAMVMGKMGNHPNLIQFVGSTTLEVSFTPSAVGENPLYQSQTMQGENPLFESSADPGTPGSVISITFELDNTTLTPSDAGNGLIHRDIAARNFLVQTTQGSYESAPGEFLLFGNDGPPDLRKSGGIGPVRWMAPESLRLYQPGTQGSTDPGDYFDINAFSFFDVSYVPEPGALSVFVLGLGCVARRAKR